MAGLACRQLPVHLQNIVGAVARLAETFNMKTRGYPVNLIKKILVAQAAVLFMLAGSAAHAAVDEEVAARLKPVGDVCIEGQECAAVPAAATADAAASETAAAPAAAAGRSGEEIVAQSCGVCHGTGLLEAPLTGDKDAWNVRSDAAGGMDGLLAVAKGGKGAMPPMGTCGTCTDDELVNAIKFMSGL